jgi:ADP-heptose:LPS heptosyltransferase
VTTHPRYESVKKILVSRTDAIGDVVLTLPLVALLRRQYPAAEICFLGSHYTKDIVDACENIDAFLDWTAISSMDAKSRIAEIGRQRFDVVLHVFPQKQIAAACKRARVPLRIGTASRLFHWWTCNVRPSLHRSRSNRHEAQLNIDLALQAGLLDSHSTSRAASEVSQLWKLYGLSPRELDLRKLALPQTLPGKKVILHVGSRSSARNWPTEHFVELAKKVAGSCGVVFLTGTQSEGDQFRDRFLLLKNPRIIDLTGTMSLKELFSFIATCDALVACSTGPLHLAAAAGVRAVGVYPPMRPLHPQRWAPIGKNAVYLCRAGKSDCRDCESDASDCRCMREIAPDSVFRELFEEQSTAQATLIDRVSKSGSFEPV